MFGLFSKPVKPPPVDYLSWLNSPAFGRIFLCVWIRDTCISPYLHENSGYRALFIWIVQALALTVLNCIPDPMASEIFKVFIDTCLAYAALILTLFILYQLPEFLIMTMYAFFRFWMFFVKIMRPVISLPCRLDFTEILAFLRNTFGFFIGRGMSTTGAHSWFWNFDANSGDTNRSTKARTTHRTRSTPNTRQRNFGFTVAGGLSRRTRSGLIYGNYSPTRRRTSSRKSFRENSANNLTPQGCEFSTTASVNGDSRQPQSQSYNSPLTSTRRRSPVLSQKPGNLSARTSPRAKSSRASTARQANGRRRSLRAKATNKN